jgi:hypothetical protein
MTIDKSLKFFVLALVLLIGMSGVYATRGLYADGSFWLYEMLSRGGFYIFDGHRAYAQILMQLPVIIPLELGSQDLNLLIRAHSFGFVFVPLIFWLGALALQIDNRLFWFFLMAFCVTYLRSNFFAASECSITYGMTAFCASILLKQRIHLTLAALLIFTSVALTHSYEITLFLGLLLAILSILRLVKEKQDRVTLRFCIMISLVFFLISSYVGFQSAFFQRSYDGRSTANLSALTEIHFIYLLAIPLLIALLCIVASNKFKKILWVAIVLLICFYSLYALRWDHTNISFGYLSYAYRALVGVLLAEIIVSAMVLNYYFRPPSVTARHLASDARLGLIVTFFFMPLACLMLFHTHGFYKWCQRFEAEVMAVKHHTYINKTKINANHGMNSGYNWPWGNSYTSILLRGNAEALILNSSDYQAADGSCYESLGQATNQGLVECRTGGLYPLSPINKLGRLFP